MSRASLGGVSTSRRHSLHSATLRPLEALALRLPAFMHTGSSRDIPTTVSARGYEPGMPVAFEPEPTKQPTRREEAPTKANLDRRSTMPSQTDLAFLRQPPMLFPTLTPSCDLCSSDLDEHAALSCSHIWCEECDLFLCAGSEVLNDAVEANDDDASSSAATMARAATKPKECNLRLHRHHVMQGHVRLPASTAMQIEKLLRIEEAKEDSDSARLSRKQIVLALFVLPMRGVAWQFQSMAGMWIDFDAQTQNLLESELSSKSKKKAHEFKLEGHYAVHSAKRRKGQREPYYMLNSLTSRRAAVRRLDSHTVDYDSESASTVPYAMPNSRPTSARRTATVSPTNIDPFSSYFNIASTSQSSASSTPRTSPPALQRRGSVDSQQMTDFANWSDDEWLTFARDQPRLVPGAPGSIGHELEDVADERHDRLHPLFEMERGNPLLLAVYHGNLGATTVLLENGFSCDSRTSWTKLNALQVACMQGSLEIATVLLDAGADPSYKASSCTMAIEYAVKSGRVPLVELLLARRHSDGDSALVSSKRCVAYSDLLLRDQRRQSVKRRSTWVDIGAEDDENGLLSPKRLARASPSMDQAIGDASDQDAQLYSHLLTEALNVPPLSAHTTGVVELLLERMLQRASAMDPPPAFELSRYHEWMSTCVASASVERLRFLVSHRSRYTAHLSELDSVSQDFAENLTDERYAHAVLKEQASLDALFFQACQQHPASVQDEGDSEDDENDLDPADTSSSPFDLLSILITSGADVNHIETDLSDGTQLNALLMSVRDRKVHLTRFLVEHGMDVEALLRCERLDLDDAHAVDVSSKEERCIDDQGKVCWFRRMDWSKFATDECAHEPEEIDRTRNVIAAGLMRRHERAKRLAQTVLRATELMTGQSGHLGESSSPLGVCLFTPFSVPILHVISSFCFGRHALTIGAQVSPDGTTLALPDPAIMKSP